MKETIIMMVDTEEFAVSEDAACIAQCILNLTDKLHDTMASIDQITERLDDIDETLRTMS